MTAKDRRQALRIGRSLVEKRLASCVNLLGRIESIYWWDGRLNSDKETAFIAKTNRRNLAKLISEVKAGHSYSVPCIVAMPVVGGNPDFLAWINKETRPR